LRLTRFEGNINYPKSLLLRLLKNADALQHFQIENGFDFPLPWRSLSRLQKLSPQAINGLEFQTFWVWFSSRSCEREIRDRL